MAGVRTSRILMVCGLAGAMLLVTATVGLARDIYGTEEADYLEGTNYADRIAGRGGDDYIWAKRGGDKIYPQNGADNVFAGAGRDEVDLVIDNDRAVDEAYCGTGSDTVYFHQEDWIRSDCEIGYMCEGVRWGCRRMYTPYYGHCDDGQGNNACD